MTERPLAGQVPERGTTTERPTGIEQKFHQEMLGIYEAALRLKPPYRATRFLRMVNERGGIGAAQALLATGQPSDGFTELYLRGCRLDLSVEYLVLKCPWRGLFSPEQLAIARRRLEEHQFAPPPEDSCNPGDLPK